MKHPLRQHIEEIIPLTDEDFAWDAYAEVGPGKHFLGTQHTMRHYKDAFYDHQIFKTDSYEQWADEGAPTTYEMATDMWKKLLKEYEAPPISSLRWGCSSIGRAAGLYSVKC